MENKEWKRKGGIVLSLRGTRRKGLEKRMWVYPGKTAGNRVFGGKGRPGKTRKENSPGKGGGSQLWFLLFSWFKKKKHILSTYCVPGTVLSMEKYGPA